MIKLQNQFVLQFNIGDGKSYVKTDFVDVDDFHFLRIAENGGGLRPIINLSFTVKDNSIIPYLNNGNIITILYGVNEPDSEPLQFEIMGDNKVKEYKAGSKVDILGAMYNRDFTSVSTSFTFYNKKSIDVIRAIAKKDKLKLHTNKNIKTLDAQNWYQSGKTDWNMFKYVAKRAYKSRDTFFAYGFDNNNIYFYDVKEHLKEGIKWYFTVNSAGTNKNSNVVNIGTYLPDDSKAGVNGDLAGRNVINHSYNLDTGEFGNPQHVLRTMTTQDTNSINISSEGCKKYNYSITTGDEHANTILAENQNERNGLLFSSYSVDVPIVGDYKDFKLFDVVQLIPSDKDKEVEGIYFITGIAKEFSNMQYKTMLTLNRESPNGIKGNLDGG